MKIDKSRIINIFYWGSKETSVVIILFFTFQLVFWYLIGKYIKVKKPSNKIVIAFTSIGYNGNSRAVFDELSKDTKYECYWIARNKKSLDEVKKINGNSIYAYFPLISIKYLLNTDILVTSDTSLGSLFVHKQSAFCWD